MDIMLEKLKSQENFAKDDFAENFIISLIQKEIGKENFKLKAYRITLFDALHGFLSRYKKVQVVYELELKEYTLNWFVKSVPEDPDKVEFTRPFHNKEQTLYANIFKYFQGDIGPQAWRPRCIHVSNQHLILEDLNSIGYKMGERTRVFDKDHCFVAIECLAKMHAESILFEENKSLEYKKPYRLTDDHKNELNYLFYTTGESWVEAAIEANLKAVESFSKYGKNFSKFSVISAKWKDSYKCALAESKPSSSMRNTLTHCDLWNNNFMFSYDNLKKPQNCVILDYQLVIYATPTVDLMSLIYANTDKLLRNTYKKEFITFYFDKLKKVLESRSINIENIFDFETFLESCEMKRNWGLAHSSLMGPQTWVEEKTSREMFKDTFKRSAEEKVDYVIRIMNLFPILKERVMDILDEFIEGFVLN